MAAGQRVSSRVLQDARLGWGDFAKRGFKSYRVPGSHDSMFSEEYVEPLARLLRGILLDSRQQPVENFTRQPTQAGRLKNIVY